MTTPGSGHNGVDPTVRHERGQCKNCIHWLAPSDNEQRAYEMFRLGLSRKRVKRPSGTCDRVLLGGRSSTVFLATTAEFGCLNFEAKPRPARPVGGGFVTIWRNGRIAWQGPEENTPSRYLQETLDLEGGETPEIGEG